MEQWYSCEFAISVLVKCDDEKINPADLAIKKLNKIKFPKNINIMGDCLNVFSEEDGLKIE